MSEETPYWEEADEAELRYYYRHEFPEHLDKLPAWITPHGPKQHAVALDRRYPVEQRDGAQRNKTRQFIRRSTRSESQGEVFPSWDEVVDLYTDPAGNDPLREMNTGKPGLAHPAKVNEDPPLPDAVYYSLDHHERFWVLAFDIDAKDVAADEYRRPNDDRKRSQILEEEGVKDAAPEGYPYRFEHIQRTVDYAVELAGWLTERVDFEDVQVIYSGQGTHVYALDQDRYHRYTKQTREFLIDVVKEKRGIPIDEQVTPDDERVVRMPYSMHSDVTRVVTPVNSPDFDFRTDALPRFVEEDIDVEAALETGG